MAISNVGFGDGQQQQQSSSGILLPVVGTAAGAGIGAFTKLGRAKVPQTLEDIPSKDVFVNTMTKGFEGENKTAADTVAAYLAERDAAKGTASSTPAATTPVAPAKSPATSPAGVPVKTNEEMFLENQFKYNMTDLEVQSATSKRAQAHSLYERLLDYGAPSQTPFAQGETADSVANRIKILDGKIDLEKANLERENVDDATKAKIQAKIDGYEAEKTNLDAKLDHEAGYYENKFAKTLQDEMEKSDKYKEPIANANIEKINAETLVTIQNSKLAQAKANLQNAKVAGKPKEEIDKLQAIVDNEQKVLTPLEQSSQMANKKLELLKSEQKFSSEVVEALKQPTDDARKNKLNELIKRQNGKLGSAENENTLLGKANKYWNEASTNYGAHLKDTANAGETAEFNAKFLQAMGKTAPEVKATEVKAGEVVKAEAPKASEAVANAFGKIKDSLKTDRSVGKIAIAAGIGLAVGIIAKMMVDGSNKQA